PDCAGDVDSRRSPKAQALVLKQVEYKRHCLLVGNPIGDIDRRVFQVLGDAALPDPFGNRGALGFEHAGGVVAVECRTERIGKRNLDGPVALLEGDADAGERSAGADRADEPVHFAFCLAPDFGAGCLHVAVAVGDVVELVGPDSTIRLGLRQRVGKPAGQFHVVVRVRIGNRRYLDEFSAAQTQRVFLFLALRVRNHDYAAEAERIADQCKADAGVAGGALDDDAAGTQTAAFYRVLDDEQCRPILDRLAGIHEFSLAENGAAGLLRGVFEFDEGGVADGFGDSVANLHDAFDLGVQPGHIQGGGEPIRAFFY